MARRALANRRVETGRPRASRPRDRHAALRVDGRARTGQGGRLVRDRAGHAAPHPRPGDGGSGLQDPALPLRRRVPQHPRLGRSAPASPQLPRQRGRRRVLSTGWSRPTRRRLPSWAVTRLTERGMQRMAESLIAGRDATDALPTLKRLRRRHTGFTLDLLGETCFSDAESEDVRPALPRPSGLPAGQGRPLGRGSGYRPVALRPRAKGERLLEGQLSLLPDRSARFRRFAAGPGLGLEAPVSQSPGQRRLS